MNYATRYQNLNDLARLPWFAVKDGRLALSDPSLSGTIDVHTHLALSYLKPLNVDLQPTTHQALYYLAADVPLDLDVYVNKNIPKDGLERMNQDLIWGSLKPGGMRATHTIGNIRRDMDLLGIESSVLLPIDWPAGSKNSETWLEATHNHPPLLCFGSVHPFDPHLEARLDAQVALGARGIKVHPNVQLIRPDWSRALRLYRACAERKLPVLFHCGPVEIEPPLGRYLSLVRFVAKAIEQCPQTTFVLGHSGALQFEEGLALAQRHPNVWLETSSQSLTNVRRILAEAPQDRILFGSDWPFYNQAIPLAKILIAAENDAPLRRKVLRENAVRLLGLAG